MAVLRKKKIIEITALNLLVNINEAMVRFFRRGEAPAIKLPSLIDRAFMVHHEAGIVPTEEIVITEGGETHG